MYRSDFRVPIKGRKLKVERKETLTNLTLVEPVVLCCDESVKLLHSIRQVFQPNLHLSYMALGGEGVRSYLILAEYAVKMITKFN